MVSAGTYILGVALLGAVALAVGFSAHRLRQRLLPSWTGAPARLVEAVVGIALLLWLAEILGSLQLFYAWALVASSLLFAGAVAWWLGPSPSGDRFLPGGGAVGGTAPEEASATAGGGGSPAATGPAGPNALAWVVTIGVVAVVFAHWGLTAKDALDRGIFNFDSLWYHMPFAVEMVQSHSTTGLHYTETVFTNWLYPQNSEALHAVGILLTQRDTLSLFLNFGFLGLAFLAAWCIGRPYGRGHLTVLATAVLLECHTLVVREPGAAKNDLVAAALLLAAVAILLTAWSNRRDVPSPGGQKRPPGDGTSALGWGVAAAGLAAGLAVGTKSTAVAIAAALTLAVVVLAPRGRRWAAAGWWLLPALLGGGYWYLRNLIVAGNPLPQATGLGPLPLPHPERLQEGRPDFSVAHYLTDTGVWRDYFEPGLHQAFGALWPLVLAGAVAGALLALLRGRDLALRWLGGVALFGLLAYLFTPLSAAGAEGAPTGFGINIRYAIPALLLGAALLPLAADGPKTDAMRRFSARRRWVWVGGLVAVLVVTDRADAALRDPDRLFAWGVALLFVLIPALILWRAGASGGRRGRALLVGGFAALALLVAILGYPVQRDYLRARFAAGSDVPGMDLDRAYRWARGQSDARIGLAGTTAGFLEYGFYGTDLSNDVVYLGEKAPHAAFNAIPTCTAFREAVNAADLDYLLTTPFLNFLHPSEPVPSPEEGWLEGEPAVDPIQRSGPTTVWRVQGRLDPTSCGPANRPLQRVPNTPGEPGQ